MDTKDQEFTNELERGADGKDTSKPLIDVRNDGEKDAAQRGNEAGKVIREQKKQNEEE